MRLLLWCCMVLHHSSITSYTKSFLLRSIFQKENIEIEVLDKATTAIFIERADKEKVWQATVDLESIGIQTVYAFHDEKDKVLEDALGLLAQSRSGEYQK